MSALGTGYDATRPEGPHDRQRRVTAYMYMSDTCPVLPGVLGTDLKVCFKLSEMTERRRYIKTGCTGVRSGGGGV